MLYHLKLNRLRAKKLPQWHGENDAAFAAFVDASVDVVVDVSLQSPSLIIMQTLLAVQARIYNCG
jgi:hypothetical protein